MNTYQAGGSTAHEIMSESGEVQGGKGYTPDAGVCGWRLMKEG